MNNGISVVIPNYNGAELLIQTLPTVFEALKNSKRQYEIIIADDCSTDNSLQIIETYYVNIIIVETSVNSGFSITSNLGINKAKYDIVLLLNSDVKLEPNYFDTIFTYFDDPRVFGVMGRIIGWDNDNIQDGAKYPSYHGAKIKTTGNYLLKNQEKMATGIYTMYLSGANMLINKQAFIKIGEFNTIFSPFYSEDFELSLRAWRLGYNCIYHHNSICRHKESITIKKNRRKFFIDTIYDRNKMYIHAIHLEGTSKLVWYLQLFLETLIRILTGRWHYILSLVKFLNSKKKIIQSVRGIKRCSTKSNGILSVKQVVNFITSNIKDEYTRF